MVIPGTLPLEIIRGIAFDSQVLTCADGSVAVSGTLSPDVTGDYVLCGTFGGLPLFILSGAPSTFCYFNATAASYVLARILTTGALTDYWSPAAPITEPTGTYVAHGANTGTATATDHPFDLTGYTVQATVRRSTKVGAEVIIDLQPSVTTPLIGEITIPSISQIVTDKLAFTGNFIWDLVLVDGVNERHGPFISGPFVISDNVTQP
jgi:hypothetical protein